MYLLQLDRTYQKIDALPRPEAAPKRTTLGKLMKDFDKVKVNIQAIMNEASLVKVVNERGEVESFARTPAMAPTSGTAMSWGNPDSGNGSSIDNGNGNSSNPDSVNPPLPPMTRREKEQYMQQLKLKPLMHGQDVDDAIMEERERDIKKMNQDLILVNEMFKYVIINDLYFVLILVTVVFSNFLVCAPFIHLFFLIYFYAI